MAEGHHLREQGKHNAQAEMPATPKLQNISPEVEAYLNISRREQNRRELLERSTVVHGD